MSSSKVFTARIDLARAQPQLIGGTAGNSSNAASLRRELDLRRSARNSAPLVDGGVPARSVSAAAAGSPPTGRSSPPRQQQQQQHHYQARSASENKASLLRAQLQHPEIQAPRNHVVRSSAGGPPASASPKYFVVGLHPSHTQQREGFGSPPPPPVGTATQRLAASASQSRLTTANNSMIAPKPAAATAAISAAEPPVVVATHLDQFRYGRTDANFPLRQQQIAGSGASVADSPPPIVSATATGGADADARERNRAMLWQLFQSCSRMHALQQRRMAFDGFAECLTELQRRRLCHPVCRDDALLLWRLASLNERNGGVASVSSPSPSPASDGSSGGGGDSAAVLISWQSFYRVMEQRVVVSDAAILAALRGLTGDDDYFAMLPPGAVPLSAQLMQPATAARLEQRRSSQSQSREPSQQQQQPRSSSVGDAQNAVADVSVAVAVEEETPIKHEQPTRQQQQQQQQQLHETVIMSPEPEQRLSGDSSMPLREQPPQPQALTPRFSGRNSNMNTSNVTGPRAEDGSIVLSPTARRGFGAAHAATLQPQSARRSPSPNLGRGEPQPKGWNASHARGDGSRVAKARQLYSDPTSLPPPPQSAAAVAAPHHPNLQPAPTTPRSLSAAPRSGSATTPAVAASGGIHLSIPHQSSPPSKPNRHFQTRSREEHGGGAVTPRTASANNNSHTSGSGNAAVGGAPHDDPASEAAAAIAHHRIRMQRMGGHADCPSSASASAPATAYMEAGRDTDFVDGPPAVAGGHETPPPSARRGASVDPPPPPLSARGPGGQHAATAAAAAANRSHSRLVERHLEEQQQQQAQLQSMILQRAIGNSVCPPPASVDDMMHARFPTAAATAAAGTTTPRAHLPPSASAAAAHQAIAKELFLTNSKIAAARCPHRRVPRPSPDVLEKEEARAHQVFMAGQQQQEQEEQDAAAEERRRQPTEGAAATPAPVAAAAASPLVVVSPNTPAPDTAATAAGDTTTAAALPETEAPQQQQPLRLAVDWKPARLQCSAQDDIARLRGWVTSNGSNGGGSTAAAADDAEKIRAQEAAASKEALAAWQRARMPPPPPRPVTTPRSGSANIRTDAPPRHPPAGAPPLQSPSKLPTMQERLEAAKARNTHFRF